MWQFSADVAYPNMRILFFITFYENFKKITVHHLIIIIFIFFNILTNLKNKTHQIYKKNTIF